MSIREAAISEMQRANFEPGDIEAMSRILDIFFDQWNSGGAVWAMLPVLERCISGAPLSPLTGDDDEWMTGHCEDGLSQNVRCGSVFRRDDKTWDIDAPQWDGSFPYMPGRRNLDPVIEVDA
jgi:hypothetical protein